MIFEEKYYFFCYILLTDQISLFGWKYYFGHTTLWAYNLACRYMVVLAIVLQHKSNIEPMKRLPADILISPTQHRYCSQYDTHDILHSRIGF